MAFYLENCPEGWAPANGTNGTPDLRGQFVRARDDRAVIDGGQDPDGIRALGSVQLDAFQGHRHALTGNSYSGSQIVPTLSTGYTMTGEYVDGQVRGPISDGVNGTPRIANETRPKNAALTFCMRKN
jgi:hypothetical protein